MTASPQQLRYEPTPKWHRRRTFLRLIVPAALAAVLAAGWWYGQPLWRRVQVIELQRRCLDYRPPPAPRVVFVDDRRMAAPLLAMPDYLPDFSGGARAVYHNPVWRAYAGSAQPVAYMGRRTSPRGNERLVAIQFSTLGGSGGDPYHRIFFAPYIDGLATLRGRHFVAGAATLVGLEIYRNAGDWTAVVEGVSDPSDPSHFTIDYSLNNTPGTIDGWLNDDDTVTLSPRTGVTADAGARYVLWSPGGGPLPDWVAGRAPVRDATTQPILPKR